MELALNRSLLKFPTHQKWTRIQDKVQLKMSLSAAVINTTSSSHTDFTTDPDSLSDDDLLGSNDGGAPIDDLDLDEEIRLLQTSSPTNKMSNYAQLPSSNRKCKMKSDDECGKEVDKKKRKTKTLGVKMKNTGRAANFGKSV